MSDEPETVVGAASKFAQSLVGALPPAFLLLCLLNVAFLGMVMWFLADQVDRRTTLVSTVITRCMDIALHAPPPGPTIEPPGR